MANSKLHDDFVNEIESLDDVETSVAALVNALADRIEASHGNPVKLTDLKTVLREDPGKIAKAVLANTPAARNKTMTTSGHDAPSTAFERPREGVRDGMASSPNDHRDQQFPENANTEAEQERIKREQTARDRGMTVSVNEDMPEPSLAQKQIDEDRKDEQHRKEEWR